MELQAVDVLYALGYGIGFGLWGRILLNDVDALKHQHHVVLQTVPAGVWKHWTVVCVSAKTVVGFCVDTA